MELIDRQALIATLGIKEECSECVHKALIYCKLDAANACDAIMNAPTIEAEPKIKCKDCKHSSYEPCEGYDNVYVCNRTPFARMEGGRLPNFYCGYGERREE